MQRFFPLLLLLSGCSNISFQVSPDADSTPSSDEHDASQGIGMPEISDAAPDGTPSTTDAGSVCPPNDCHPGCAPCATGFTCGAAGDFRCGSSNCYKTDSADAGCSSSEQTSWCDEYGGKTDVMPSCIFKFAQNVNTNLYCCTPL